MPLVLIGCSHGSVQESTKPNWLAPFRAKTWVRQTSEKSYSLTNVTHEGRESLRFELRSGDAWDEGEGTPTFRSEISTHQFPPMGAEKWYSFSVFLPRDFPIENNRLVLAQWWAKTKTNLGEVHRNPILHLRFADGTLAILLRRYPEKIVHDEHAYEQTNLFSKRLELGKWNDFVFHVKWSPVKDGLIQAWWNGNQIIDFKGATENQDEVGPVFKFGLYRDDSPKTYVSYVSDVFIGSTPESIHSSVK